MKDKDFGDRVRSLRSKRVREDTGKPWSQDDLAEQAATTRNTVSSWEAGTVPRGAALQRLARVLETSPSYLLGGVEESRDTPTSLPRQLQIRAAEYELEALKAGADTEDMQYIRAALNSPEAMQLYKGGYSEPLSLEEQQMEMESLIEMLRLWLRERLKRRAAAKRRSR